MAPYGKLEAGRAGFKNPKRVHVTAKEKTAMITPGLRVYNTLTINIITPAIRLPGIHS